MPTPEVIRTTIMSHINASWTTTEIVFPNRSYKPKGDKWIRPAIIMGDSYEGEKGTDGLGLRTGVLMISVMTPANTGNKTGLDYATTLESLFRRRTMTGVMFSDPNTREIGLDDSGYYHVMVSVPFHAWIGD